tara:strand:+ start:687 stop:1322 length:636 start_codon:yes stop_codon:yes gene_type:complete
MAETTKSVTKMSENTKVMSEDDFAVYSAKVNEWHEAATPLVNAISTKKQKTYASFDLQQITMLLEQMADTSPTSELKQRIHLAGRQMQEKYGISLSWPFQRGRGTTLSPEIQANLDSHIAVAEEFWGTVYDASVDIQNVNHLSVLRLSGRDSENPYGVIETREEFIALKVNAEKQNLMSKYRANIWDGNSDMTFTVATEESTDSVETGADE